MAVTNTWKGATLVLTLWLCGMAMPYHCTPTGEVKWKRQTIPSVDKDVEELKPSTNGGGGGGAVRRINGFKHFGKLSVSTEVEHNYSL